jgi:hypothetical protein
VTISRHDRPVHASDTRITLPEPDVHIEHTFVHDVIFVPIRAPHQPSDNITCWWHPTLEPQPPLTDQLAILDFHTRLGGQRREPVCGRCATEALHDTTREGPVVVWHIDPDAPDAIDTPRPLGQNAVWPTDAAPAA